MQNKTQIQDTSKLNFSFWPNWTQPDPTRRFLQIFWPDPTRPAGRVKSRAKSALWCPPRLSSRPSTLCHVYNPVHYSCFIHFFKSPSLRRWYTTFPLLLSIKFPLQHHSQTALQQISSWMTANLLTLNSSKTEFLLIGLKQQLSKIQDCSLTTTHFAGYLGFIFDEHITFSDQITAFSESCYYHIRELRCIRPYLDPKQPAPLPLPSFILNLTTVTLSIITFQTVNLPSPSDPELSCSCCCC